MRGGAVVARQAHNLKAVGSIPAPATNYLFSRPLDGFFLALNHLAPQRFAEATHSPPSLKTA